MKFGLVWAIIFGGLRFTVFGSFAVPLKELVVLAPGEWLSNLVYCCDNRWCPNHVVTHGHKTQHVFDMDENNSVGITTSENSWNRACHVSSYYSILFGCWTIYPK